MKSSRIFGRRNGQAIILVAVAMSLVLIGVLGFAIDGGQMYAQRQMAQAAADAAAQAGVMSIYDGTNATSTYTFGTGSTPIPSSTCTTTDGRTPCVYARYNGFGGTSSDTVRLSYPATVSGATLSSATVPAFQVTVQRNVATGFIKFLGGPATTSITAKAIAGIAGVVSPDSIFILSSSGKDAFVASGTAVVTVSGGGGIAINSSNAEAALVKGSASVSAASISVAGGISVTGTATTTPAPVTNSKAVADPFINLSAPTVGSCASFPTQYSPPNGTTLQPGTYCGGITVGGIANVTFAAGTYIINGGGLSFTNSAVANGSGVTFFLTGTNATYGSVTAGGASTVTLSGPTSGTYQGVLFYQDRTITSANNASFGNSAIVTLTGSLYFPTTGVTFSGATSSSSYMAIIADSVSFTGSSNISYDPTGQKTGLTTSKAVALLQ